MSETNQPDSGLLVIVLAAGEGTRMKSARPKVLHELAGRSMLGHVLGCTAALAPSRICVVVGPDRDDVRAEARAIVPDCLLFEQTERLGTAHAVLAARSALTGFAGDVLVLYGDTPLLTAQTLADLRTRMHQTGSRAGVLGFESRTPTGYGRLLLDDAGGLVAIREEKEASAAEKAITFCNSGVFCLDGRGLVERLEQIGNDNAKGEYYLTDIISVLRNHGGMATTTSCDEQEVLGVNSRVQLAEAEAICQARLRQRHMENGATLVAPQTVTFSWDTELGRDIVIEPNVVFGTGVKVADQVTIRAFSHIEGAHIQSGAVIGPFARLRPGARIGVDVKIGNFVEIKNADIDRAAKVNHLSYIGDASIGEGVNIGAGTITCNYDGWRKYKTEIGARAFIGSNSALIAPVKIGAGAYIGSGSVISKPVAPDALALTRPPLVERPGWAQRFRERQARVKAGQQAD